MRHRFILILAAVIFLMSGCSRHHNSPSLSGKWKGNIIEKGKSVLVGLEFIEKDASFTGSFTILSETGEEAKKGMVFPVTDVQRSGSTIKFVVRMAGGRIDNDALVFFMAIRDDKMKGHVQELRKGSSKIPITFIKE